MARTDDVPSVIETVKDLADDYQETLDRLHDIVMTNSVGSSEGRRERLASVVSSLTDRLMEIVERPDEPSNSDVVRFTKRFRSDGKRYEYVGVKSDGRWYLSCRDRRHDKPLTWDELLDFAYDSYGSQLTLKTAAGWFNVFTDN
jgi:hypothetical protein